MITLYLAIFVLSVLSLLSGNLMILTIGLILAFACIAKEAYDKR